MKCLCAFILIPFLWSLSPSQKKKRNKKKSHRENSLRSVATLVQSGECAKDYRNFHKGNRDEIVFRTFSTKQLFEFGTSFSFFFDLEEHVNVMSLVFPLIWKVEEGGQWDVGFSDLFKLILCIILPEVSAGAVNRKEQ